MAQIMHTKGAMDTLSYKKFPASFNPNMTTLGDAASQLAYSYSFPLVELSASVSFWATFYYICTCLYGKSKPEWSIRTITLCHASTVTFLSAFSVFVMKPSPFLEPGGPSTTLQTFVIVVSLGYFIVDTIWCLYYRTEGIVMMFHHVASTIALTVMLILGVSGNEVVAALGGLEVTNPLLQTRWFLRQLGYKRRLLSVVNEWTFFFLFLFLRIVVGTWLLVIVLRHPRPHIITKLGGIMFYIISWVFIIMMTKYACRKYFRPSIKDISDSEKEN